MNETEMSSHSHSPSKTSLDKLIAISFPGEKWKPVEEEGVIAGYVVSNMGRLCRILKSGTKILRLCRDRKGYLKKSLSLGTSHKSITVRMHRLVAKYFVENPCPLLFNQVNHLDENKANNAADNLEWCDNLYNIRYGSGRMRSAESQRRSRPDMKPVVAVSSDGTRHWFCSLNGCARSLGLDFRHVSHCLTGRQKTHGGYRFEWAS